MFTLLKMQVKRSNNSWLTPQTLHLLNQHIELSLSNLWQVFRIHVY